MSEYKWIGSRQTQSMHCDLIKTNNFAYKKVLNKTRNITNDNANEIRNFHAQEASSGWTYFRRPPCSLDTYLSKRIQSIIIPFGVNVITLASRRSWTLFFSALQFSIVWPRVPEWNLQRALASYPRGKGFGVGPSSRNWTNWLASNWERIWS